MSNINDAKPLHPYVTGTSGPLCFGALAICPVPAHFQRFSIAREGRNMLLIATEGVEKTDADRILKELRWDVQGKVFEDVVADVVGANSEVGLVKFSYDPVPEKQTRSTSKKAISQSGRRAISISVAGRVQCIVSLPNAVQLFGEGTNNVDIPDADWCLVLGNYEIWDADAASGIAAHLCEQIMSSLPVVDILVGRRMMSGGSSAMAVVALIACNIRDGENMEGWPARVEREMSQVATPARPPSTVHSMAGPLPVHLWCQVAEFLPFNPAVWRLSVSCSSLHRYLLQHRLRFLELGSDRLLMEYHREITRRRVNGADVVPGQSDRLDSVVGLRLGHKRGHQHEKGVKIWTTTSDYGYIDDLHTLELPIDASDGQNATAMGAPAGPTLGPVVHWPVAGIDYLLQTNQQSLATFVIDMSRFDVPNGGVFWNRLFQCSYLVCLHLAKAALSTTATPPNQPPTFRLSTLMLESCDVSCQDIIKSILQHCPGIVELNFVQTHLRTKYLSPIETLSLRSLILDEAFMVDDQIIHRMLRRIMHPSLRILRLRGWLPAGYMHAVRHASGLQQLYIEESVLMPYDNSLTFSDPWRALAATLRKLQLYRPKLSMEAKSRITEFLGSIRICFDPWSRARGARNSARFMRALKEQKYLGPELEELYQIGRSVNQQSAAAEMAGHEAVINITIRIVAASDSITLRYRLRSHALLVGDSVRETRVTEIGSIGESAQWMTGGGNPMAFDVPVTFHESLVWMDEGWALRIVAYSVDQTGDVEVVGTAVVKLSGGTSVDPPSNYDVTKSMQDLSEQACGVSLTVNIGIQRRVIREPVRIGRGGLLLKVAFKIVDFSFPAGWDTPFAGQGIRLVYRFMMLRAGRAEYDLPLTDEADAGTACKLREVVVWCRGGLESVPGLLHGRSHHVVLRDTTGQRGDSLVGSMDLSNIVLENGTHTLTEWFHIPMQWLLYWSEHDVDGLKGEPVASRDVCGYVLVRAQVSVMDEEF
ncbi:hypothetical protein HDV00_007285 [Rhizophlyctis rosea]|nr:hypothetical protein HDV00_007285 [Rhizophlyctis rosea]